MDISHSFVVTLCIFALGSFTKLRYGDPKKGPCAGGERTSVMLDHFLLSGWLDFQLLELGVSMVDVDAKLKEI